jgi:transcriptional regulator with XRE-family HTH domain
MTTEPDDIELYDVTRLDRLTFAVLIRSHRQGEDWTLEVAASKLGVSAQMLSAYERGIKIPSIPKAVEIATLLGLSPLMAIKYVVNDQLKQANLPYRVEKIAS